LAKTAFSICGKREDGSGAPFENDFYRRLGGSGGMEA